jgi:hypothetical protein
LFFFLFFVSPSSWFFKHFKLFLSKIILSKWSCIYKTFVCKVGPYYHSELLKKKKKIQKTGIQIYSFFLVHQKIKKCWKYNHKTKLFSTFWKISLRKLNQKRRRRRNGFDIWYETLVLGYLNSSFIFEKMKIEFEKKVIIVSLH